MVPQKEMNDVLVSFPPLDPECSMFISVGIPKRVLQKEEKNQIENFIAQLKKLQEIYKKLLSKPLEIPSFQPPQSRKYRRKILFLQNQIKEDLTTVFLYHQQIYAKFYGLADQMIKILCICEDHNVTCSCDIAAFQQYTSKDYQNDFPISNFQWKSKALYSKLQKIMEFNAKVSIPNWQLLLQRLTQQIKRQTPQVNLDLGYCPPSPVDQSLSAIFLSRKTEIDVKPAIEQMKNFDLTEANNMLVQISKRLNLSSKPEFIVFKCAFMRFLFDLLYHDSYKLFDTEDNNKFIQQCAVVSSFSPSDLELCENPFTDDQFKTAIHGLLAMPLINSISDSIILIPFYTNPIDIVADLAKSLHQLSDVARKNDAERKMGRFASMVEDYKKKKREIMSFDDCFSLFFVSFVMKPPSGAPGIANFVSKYDIGYTREMKYAESILMASIQHAMDFSPIVLQNDDSESTDPLGINTSQL